MAEPDKRPVRLEEPHFRCCDEQMYRVKGLFNPPEAAMKVILIVLMLLIPAWCYADGNELLKRCGLLVSYTDGESSDISSSAEMMFCAGFMQGITNMNLLYQEVLKSDAQFCLPEWGISNSHAARIVVKHLRDYPEELHRNEFVLAIWALNVAFPCKKGR
jgi:Rap1a immunity proteins